METVFKSIHLVLQKALGGSAGKNLGLCNHLGLEPFDLYHAVLVLVSCGILTKSFPG